ncbi:MAG: leucine-rich repeat domain-containing protein [Verrucomicrobia bacterium]|nr:leucine-rich repeat domain-containing protein [Verrucomicrobiota bacterium]
MPIGHCSAIRTTQEDPYRTRDQDAAGQDLLKVPSHILELIWNFVASGNSPLETATNSVRFSQVCVLTHLISHESGMEQKIQQNLEDDALLKIWRPLSKRVNFNGTPRPKTLGEIKEWFDNPAHTGQLNAITVLDLSDLKLKAIPPQITKCGQLRELFLDDNQITDIAALGQLSQLEELHLDDNLISDISAIGNLGKLERLSLDYNPISDFTALKNLSLSVELSYENNPLKTM